MPQAAPRARVEILGTDIDKRMVERAKEGVFSADDARSAPRDAIDRWFEPVDGGWQARSELRSICGSRSATCCAWRRRGPAST